MLGTELYWSTLISSLNHADICSLLSEKITCVHSPKPELNIPGSPTVIMGCLKSWTVILRRCSSEFNFHRSWNEYTQGFGTLPCDYYAGNSALYYYTKNLWYYLRFDIYGIDGHFYSLEFDKFQVEDETKSFKLSIGNLMSGTAGIGAMASYNHSQFSTVDNDNSNLNCTGKCGNSKQLIWQLLYFWF